MFLTSYFITGVEEVMMTIMAPVTKVVTFTLVGKNKCYVGSIDRWMEEWMWVYICKAKNFPSFSSCYQLEKERSVTSLMIRMAVSFYTHQLTNFLNWTEFPPESSAVILLNSYRSELFLFQHLPNQHFLKFGEIVNNGGRTTHGGMKRLPNCSSIFKLLWHKQQLWKGQA